MRFLRDPSAARAIRAGVALSCALLTKVSCVILVPYLALVLAAFATMERQALRDNARGLRAGAVLILGTVFVALEGLYFLLADSRFVGRAYPALGDGLLTRLALPFLEYARNVEAIRAYVAGAHEMPQFLLGSFSSQGWWYYYPVALALKTPLATLLLVAAGLGVFAWTWAPRSRLHAEGRRTHFEATALVGFVVLFIGVAMATRIDLGIRYVLPVYPFLYATIGLGLHTLLRAYQARARHVAMVAGALLLWGVTAGLRAYPNYIGYFNELVPVRAADRLLVDSNLDWGQDLKRLTRWVDENGVERIRVMYFGGGDMSYYLGDRAIRWQASRPREKGLYAVSRHLYRMSTRDAERFVDLEQYFSGARLKAIVGTSIYVFESD